VKEAIQTRAGKYEKELAKHRADDSLCKEFAAVAESFTKQINADKDAITGSRADLEDQLKYIEERIKAAGENKSLGAIQAAQAKLDAAGIKNNPYSPMTAKDAEVQWNQYKDFLAAKRTMLAEQIEHKKLRGVSLEQYNEIKNQFHQFDKDNSGSIDGKELRACLYSLGEDRSVTEIKQLLVKYGAEDPKHGGQRVMAYEGFKEFMISMLGDADTKEEILAGFHLVNKGQPIARAEHLDVMLSDTQAAYFKAHAKPASGVQIGSGWDYKAWVEEAYKE